MSAKPIKTLLWLLLLFLLPGCWDQNLLSRSIVQLGYGVDLADNGKMINTLTLATGNKKTFLISIEGDSPRDTKLHANQRLSGTIDSSKNRFVLISEEAAKKGIYPYLDVLYRDPKSALNAKIGIVQGSVEKTLRSLEKTPQLRNFDGFFTSMEKNTSIPNKNVENTCTFLFDTGKDNLLPYLNMDDQDRLIVSGSAMFHNEYYKGKLVKDDTEVLLLMMGEMADTVNLKIQTDEAPGIRGIATSNAIHADRDMSVRLEKDKVNVRIKVSLELETVEYPMAHLDDKTKLKNLEQLYEKQLTKQAKQILTKLQAANCDALGIGQRVHAFHPARWKQMNWEEDYAKVQFEPQIKVKITGTGIIN